LPLLDPFWVRPIKISSTENLLVAFSHGKARKSSIPIAYAHSRKRKVTHRSPAPLQPPASMVYWRSPEPVVRDYDELATVLVVG
jgi:hypothetical protein